MFRRIRQPNRRVAARSALRLRRHCGFESLETRTLLNAAPVAGDDSYTVVEDGKLSIESTISGTAITPVRWNQNGHFYAYVPGGISWTNAATAAAGLRFRQSAGHLVTIGSADEQNFLVTNVLFPLRNTNANIWIGLSDAAVEGQFRWVTGELLTYSNWQPGEPNNGGNEDYAHMSAFGGTFRWNDISNTGLDGYVVEFEDTANPLLGNDQDPDGDPLQTILVSPPQHGALTLNPNGTFVYTPAANYAGADSFTYKLSDGMAESNVATVSIQVTPVNDAPTAVADGTYRTDKDQVLAVTQAQGLLINDTDAEGNSLTAELVLPASRGQVVVNPNGSFQYTPNPGYYGLDTFMYRVSDGVAFSAPATVTLIVANPDNVPPVAVPDAYSVREDVPFATSGNLPPNVVPRTWSTNGNVYAAITLPVLARDAAAAAAQWVYQGVRGHLVTIASAEEQNFVRTSFATQLNSAGMLIGLSDAAQQGVWRWVTGELATYFNWNQSTGDPQGGPGEDFVEMVADGRWIDQLGNVSRSYLIEFDAPFSRSVLSNDTDPNADVLNAVLVSGPQHGSLVLNADGSFLYTPNSEYSGPDSFTYKANDLLADSNVATVQLTVAALNDPPRGQPDSFTVAEDTPLNVPAGVILANDFDPEGNPFTAVLGLPPGNGQVTLNADGSFTYTPKPNFFGTDSFSYRPKDELAGEPTVVTVQVTPVNDPPVAIDDTATVAEEGTLVFEGVNSPGLNPVLWLANGHYYAVVRQSLHWNAARTAAENLRFRGSPGHLVTITSKAENDFLSVNLLFANVNRYWIGLTDEGTEGNFRWVTGEPLTYTNWSGNNPDNALNSEHYGEIAENPQNNALWNDIWETYGVNGYLVEFEGPFVPGGVATNDNEPDGDPVTALLVNGPANGQVTLQPSGKFEYKPALNFTGQDSFTYKLSDGTLESNVATVTITVTPVNDPPVAVPDIYYVDASLTVNAANGVLANDTDIDSPRNALTAQIATLPQFGTLTLIANGSFTYVAGLAFPGTDSFTYRTRDGSLTSPPATVTIGSALRIRTENVTIHSEPTAPVEGFFDVYLELAPGYSFATAGYEVSLRPPAGSGIVFVSAGAASAAHPPLFATAPVYSLANGILRVTDILAAGAANIDHGDGLFRVQFTIPPDASGDRRVEFVKAFTNLANPAGDPLPLRDRTGGIISIVQRPAPRVGQVLLRNSSWSSEFRSSLDAQGWGYPLRGGASQLADLPWLGLDQIAVRFSEDVLVQQDDLILAGVNKPNYSFSGFSYDAATFTAVWTLSEPLSADKLLLQLAAGGPDPIRNAAGSRLDGDWIHSSSVFPSGNGISGGDFLFRLNVLPGNVDQTDSTGVFDTIKTRNKQFTQIGDPNYSPFYDVNGSGGINIQDTILVRNHQFTTLPAGEPVIGPLAGGSLTALAPLSGSPLHAGLLRPVGAAAQNEADPAAVSAIGAARPIAGDRRDEPGIPSRALLPRLSPLRTTLPNLDPSLVAALFANWAKEGENFTPVRRHRK